MVSPKEMKMPKRKRKKVNRTPRINVVFSDATRKKIKKLAEGDLTMSAVVSDLAEGAIDLMDPRLFGKYVVEIETEEGTLRGVPQDLSPEEIMRLPVLRGVAKSGARPKFELIPAPAEVVSVQSAVQHSAPDLEPLAPTSPLPISVASRPIFALDDLVPVAPPRSPTAGTPAVPAVQVAPAPSPAAPPVVEEEPAEIGDASRACGLIGGQS